MKQVSIKKWYPAYADTLHSSNSFRYTRKINQEREMELCSLTAYSQLSASDSKRASNLGAKLGDEQLQQQCLIHCLLSFSTELRLEFLVEYD